MEGTGIRISEGMEGCAGIVTSYGIAGMTGIVNSGDAGAEETGEIVDVVRPAAGDGYGLAQILPSPFSVVTEYEVPLLRTRMVPSRSVR